MRKQFNTLLVEGTHFQREAQGLIDSLLKQTQATQEAPFNGQRIEVAHLKLPHPSLVLQETIHEGLQMLANKPHFKYKDNIRKEAQRVNQINQKLNIETEEAIMRRYRSSPPNFQFKSLELGEKDYRSFHKIMNTLSTSYETSTQMNEEDLFGEKALKGSLKELQLP